jgi:hypothetical protein
MAKIFLIVFSAISALALPLSSFAQCPVCTVAVAGGVGLCRVLGISDLISGTWIGALLVLMIMWTLKWLDKKNIKFKFRRLSVIFLFYFLTIAPLYWSHFIGLAGNKLWGIDKLVFGIMVGTIGFLIAYNFENKFLRNKNQGKAYFPFQKVVVPVAFLVILSLLFQFTC